MYNVRKLKNVQCKKTRNLNLHVKVSKKTTKIIERCSRNSLIQSHDFNVTSLTIFSIYKRQNGILGYAKTKV